MLTNAATAVDGGTYSYDVTVDGNSHNTEQGNYVLQNNNTTVSFSKTGGNTAVLMGGGTWHLDSLLADRIVMTSGYNVRLTFIKQQ
jgi:hypothetical protein